MRRLPVLLSAALVLLACDGDVVPDAGRDAGRSTPTDAGDGDGDGDGDGEADGGASSPDAGKAPGVDAGQTPVPDGGASPGPDGGAGAACPGIANAAGAVLGSHCMGTNHQDITGIERVVFVGDSVTVGSPPTPSADFYRSVLADDLMQDNDQIVDCIPPEQRDKRTLVVMTMGGNDIFQISEDRAGGATPEQTLAALDEQVALLDETLAWLLASDQVPGGVFVVFANNYEFTARTGDTTQCPGAESAGYDQAWAAASSLVSSAAYANARYLELAVARGIDMIFLEEEFCAHGYGAGLPESPCYAPDNEVWFDLTCIHPNAAGHQHIAEMMLAVVEE
jgi:lysophospholipase L1-like esterase